MKHLENNGILSDLQHGYRNKCSTETQLLKVTNYFAQSLENKTQTDSIFLDFKRAFDIVPHERLLLKMNYYGFRKYLPWIRNFLSQRKQSVVIDGVKSRFVNVISGLPQGTVLAALLFLVFINDLPQSITNSFCGLFCDDTLLAKEILSDNDANELQNDLNNVLSWTELWGMDFNTVKCVQMTISNKKKLQDNQYFLGKDKLISKEYVKYLGITIDKKLTFGQHIKEKCKNATTVLNMLRRNLYFAPKSVKTKAYMSCVLPILEYASTSWQPTSESSDSAIEMVQRNAARFISNNYSKKGEFKKISITKILNDLQMETLHERRNKSRLIMAYKIINGHVILNANMLPKSEIKPTQRQCNAPNVGSNNELIEPTSRLHTTEKSFFYSIQKIWNQRVTPAQARAPSVDAFKAHFKKNHVL